ncbi:MAG: ATP-binding protein [Sulfolobales archaeon]
MRRIRLRFVENIEVDFVDRELGLKKVVEWAEKGMINVQVVYGPEGCGKTAWLKQSAELLRELGFDVIYVDPLRRDFIAYTDLKEVVKDLAEAAADIIGRAEVRLATLAIDLVKYALKRGRKRIAVLVDDAFQAIGLDKAATYVKGLLGLIEYPPADYERIVTIVATSEGVSRNEIGRHRWADLLPMWNISKEGFKHLYDQLPGVKPLFDDIWRITGGNPKLLAELYRVGWDVERVLKGVINEKKIDVFIASLDASGRDLLKRAVEDPDVLLSREGISLMYRLVELNLVVDAIPERDPWFWVDAPPPERDLGLGIGRRVAWQTPLYREAVRRSLELYG